MKLCDRDLRKHQRRIPVYRPYLNSYADWTNEERFLLEELVYDVVEKKYKKSTNI